VRGELVEQEDVRNDVGNHRPECGNPANIRSLNDVGRPPSPASTAAVTTTVRPVLTTIPLPTTSTTTVRPLELSGTTPEAAAKTIAGLTFDTIEATATDLGLVCSRSDSNVNFTCLSCNAKGTGLDLSVQANCQPGEPAARIACVRSCVRPTRTPISNAARRCGTCRPRWCSLGRPRPM
jgi:hypothetical protein